MVEQAEACRRLRLRECAAAGPSGGPNRRCRPRTRLQQEQTLGSPRGRRVARPQLLRPLGLGCFPTQLAEVPVVKPLLQFLARHAAPVHQCFSEVRDRRPEPADESLSAEIHPA